MPEDANAKPPVEIIPSVEGGLSGIASSHVPFLYFETAPAFGYLNGIVHVTLEASRLIPREGTGVSTDHVIVAHLRMNVPAALSLKSALEGALLLATQAQSESSQQKPH